MSDIVVHGYVAVCEFVGSIRVKIVCFNILNVCI